LFLIFSQGFALPEQKVEAGIQKKTENTGFPPQFTPAKARAGMTLFQVVLCAKLIPTLYTNNVKIYHWLLRNTKPSRAMESAPPGSSSLHIAAAFAIASIAGTKDSITIHPS